MKYGIMGKRRGAREGEGSRGRRGEGGEEKGVLRVRGMRGKGEDKKKGIKEGVRRVREERVIGESKGWRGMERRGGGREYER